MPILRVHLHNCARAMTRGGLNQYTSPFVVRQESQRELLPAETQQVYYVRCDLVGIHPVLGERIQATRRLHWSHHPTALNGFLLGTEKKIAAFLVTPAVCSLGIQETLAPSDIRRYLPDGVLVVSDYGVWTMRPIDGKELYEMKWHARMAAQYRLLSHDCTVFRSTSTRCAALHLLDALRQLWDNILVLCAYVPDVGRAVKLLNRKGPVLKDFQTLHA